VPLAHTAAIKKVVRVEHATSKLVNQPVKQAHVRHDLAIEALSTRTKAKRR
jgi:hypothetical protein